MFKRLATFFSPDGAEPGDGQNAVSADPDERLRVAAAALMVEAAIIDGQYHDKERVVIHRILRETFDLDDNETQALMDGAEVAVIESAQLYKFTRVIAETLDNEDRVAVVEMLWDVAFADGRIDDYEAALARRVAGLLHISDRDHAEARKRARERALS